MKIFWTELALADVEHLWHYIAADNPTAADHLLEKISQILPDLTSYPNMGRLGRVKGTRELVVLGTPYIIPYRIKKDCLEILAVLHGSRRWPENF